MLKRIASLRIGFRQHWRNLSISKKLYIVVGAMALLIACELFTLLFALHTLSAVRAFVGGEGTIFTVSFYQQPERPTLRALSV